MATVSTMRYEPANTTPRSNATEVATEAQRLRPQSSPTAARTDSSESSVPTAVRRSGITEAMARPRP